MSVNIRDDKLRELTVAIARLEHREDSNPEEITAMKEERTRLLQDIGIKPRPLTEIEDPSFGFKARRNKKSRE